MNCIEIYRKLLKCKQEVCLHLETGILFQRLHKSVKNSPSTSCKLPSGHANVSPAFPLIFLKTRSSCLTITHEQMKWDFERLDFTSRILNIIIVVIT